MLHRSQAPRAWAWWWRGAVSGFHAEAVSKFGVARDVIGANHGVWVDNGLNVLVKEQRFGRTALTSTSANGRSRVRGGYGRALAVLTTQVTLWWFGVLDTQGASSSSPRIVALQYDDIDTFPYFVAGISREGSETIIGYWDNRGYPLGYDEYTAPEIRGRPLTLALTLDAEAGWKRLYIDGVEVASVNETMGSLPLTADTQLIIHGHSTQVADANVDGSWFCAGYHNRVLTPAEIRRWSRDPMGPLTREPGLIGVPSRRLTPRLDLAVSGWGAV